MIDYRGVVGFFVAVGVEHGKWTVDMFKDETCAANTGSWETQAMGAGFPSPVWVAIARAIGRTKHESDDEPWQ